MPALPNVPNVLKFNLFWTVGGDPLAESIMFYHYTGGPPSPANCNTMCGNLVSNADSALAAEVHATVSMERATCVDLTSPTAASGEGGSPWTGVEGGGNLPAGAAVVCSYKIARRYRGGKPRNYFPMGSASDLTSNLVWDSTSITNFETAIGNFLTANLSAGAGCTIDRHVNVSYYGPPSRVITEPSGRVRNASTLRAMPLVDTITSFTVPANVGSQRRRNRNA